MFAKSQRYWFDLDPIREPLTHPEALDGTRLFGGRVKGRQGCIGSTERSRRKDAGDPRGRNPGDVWTIPTQPFPEAHFAVMAPELARRCVITGCKPGGVVLDPFCGVGTTGMVAGQNGRRFVGIDLSADTLDMALRTRLRQGALIEDGAP